MRKPVSALLSLSLCLSLLAASSAQAEKYQSRLNSLLIHQSNLYLPTRLVMGESTRFVVKSNPGDKVKVLLSAKGEGYTLPNGTPLHVGAEVQELTGTVPDTGVLELTIEMPKDEALEGQTVYVDAAAGPSDEALKPIDLIDPTGRRAEANVLVIAKPAEKGGPNFMPSMPGVDPQLMQRLSDMSSMSDEKRKQLIDNGDINRDLDTDKNPFARHGFQPGIGGPTGH